MIFTPEIVAIYLLDFLFLVFATIAFYQSVRIVRYYDKSSSEPLQYELEKKSYLSATIIKFIFFIKVPFFVFFVFTLDKISHMLIGAMCAAGVVNATAYGVALLVLKLLNLYIFAFWITLNDEDMHSIEQKYFRAKFILFIVAFFLLVGEIVLEITMFLSLDIKSVVDCCGSIFSTTDNTYMAEILSHEKFLGALFYANFILLLIGYLKKYTTLYGVVNIIFVFVSLLSLIAFFGTYIYELPTHHCPFCMLQKEYNYIGYLLYTFLFFGTFFGISLGVLEFSRPQQEFRFKISFVLNSLYTVLVSYFVVAYYLKNGVLF